VGEWVAGWGGVGSLFVAGVRVGWGLRMVGRGSWCWAHTSEYDITGQLATTATPVQKNKQTKHT